MQSTETVKSDSDAYERDDPKNETYLDYVLERADDDLR